MCNMGTRKLQGRLEKLLRKKEGGGGEKEKELPVPRQTTYTCAAVMPYLS